MYAVSETFRLSWHQPNVLASADTTYIAICIARDQYSGYAVSVGY